MYLCREFFVYYPLMYMNIFGPRALILIQVLFITWHTKAKTRVRFSSPPLATDSSVALAPPLFFILNIMHESIPPCRPSSE
jgi:hypothetical protein